MRWATLAAVTVGIALRIWQYAANPSMWVDEAAVARNVLDRSVPALFTPLDYAQVAPSGFLLATKVAAAVSGASEYSLRLTPIVAGVTSLLAFAFVARRLLPGVAAAVATFLCATAIPLVFYSSNLKPYSSDVALTLSVLAVTCAVQQSALTGWRVFWLGAFGVVALFFSQAVMFALTAAGAAVLLDGIAGSRPDRRLRIALVLCWAVAVVGSAGWSVQSITVADNVYLHRFWGPAFMPTAPGAAATWLSTTAQAVFGRSPRPDPFDGSLQYAWPALFMALLVVGAVMMCYEKPAQGIVVVGPIALAVGASAMGLYPVGTRVSLFLVPLLLLIVVYGADRLGRAIARPARGQFASLLVVPFAIVACTRQLPPKMPEHIRPVIQYARTNWQAGDALWVYYGAGQAFAYYNRLIGISGPIRVSECSRDAPREYLQQLDTERGRPRLWVLFSHAVSAERGLILRYLDSVGTRLDEFRAPIDDVSPTAGSVLLYDLSDPVKLASASWQEFPIQETFVPPRWTCYGTMSPVRERNGRAREALMKVAGP